MWLFWRMWPLTQWGEMLCWWTHVSAEMPLHSFSVWTGWECFECLLEDFVPRRNSLSLGVLVLEKGILKCPGCPSFLLSFLVKRQRKPRPAACVSLQHQRPLFCIMLKMFSSPSLCLQWLLPTTSSVSSSLLSALAHTAFLLWLVQIWLYSFSCSLPPFPS